MDSDGTQRFIIPAEKARARALGWRRADYVLRWGPSSVLRDPGTVHGRGERGEQDIRLKERKRHEDVAIL